MQEALKREFVTSYLCQDGLCLGHGEKPRLLADGTTGVSNDNGILFATYGYYLFKKELDGADLHRYHSAVKGLEVQAGLYGRRPDDHITTEAHDNRAAIAAGALLFNLRFAEHLCEYGEKHGWSYTNQAPGSWSLKQLTQGGDIAFYKLCAGRIPYPIEMLWLCGGMLLAYAKGWSSTWNLAWMKREAIPMALAPQPYWVQAMFHITNAVCAVLAQVRKIPQRQFLEYFGKDHILTRAQKVQ